MLFVCLAPLWSFHGNRDYVLSLVIVIKVENFEQLCPQSCCDRRGTSPHGLSPRSDTCGDTHASDPSAKPHEVV